MSKNDSTKSYNEIKQGHGVMLNVLENRQLRIDAALTFWKKGDISQLISFLLKTDDDSVFVDVLPQITKRLQQDEEKNTKQVSIGACLELLPIADRLLHKKFEQYLIVSLDLIRTIMKRWYHDFRKMKSESESLNASRSLNPMYVSLISMSHFIKHLSTKDKEVGRKAKIVHDMISQLT